MKIRGTNNQQPAPTARPYVLVLDNDGFVRETLVKRLTELGYRALEAVTLEEAGRKAGNKPVAALTDLSLEGPQTDAYGLGAAKVIKQVSPDTLCMVVTDCGEAALSRMVRLAMQAPDGERFDGFARKTDPDHIIDAFKQLIADEYYVEPSLVKQAFANDIRTLNDSEIEVIELVGQGMHYKEIGDALFIDEETVRKRVKKIREKLDLPGKSLPAIARAAFDLGYLRPREH